MRAYVDAGDRYERARYAVEDVTEEIAAGGIIYPSRVIAALRERKAAKADLEKCKRLHKGGVVRIGRDGRP